MASRIGDRCCYQACRNGTKRSMLQRVPFRHQYHRSAHSLSSLSKRDFADLEDRLVTKVGSRVKDPVLQSDLRTLGWIQRRVGVSVDGTVRLELKLPTLLHPSLEQLKDEVESAAKNELQEIVKERKLDLAAHSVQVVASASAPFPVGARGVDEHDELVKKLGPGLSKVAHFLAVYSCKGGVGKSTIAVNLAYELARMGGRVGLLDVDVYGPSLPTLVHPEDATVRRSPLGRGMVLPIEHHGVKILSLGFVSPESGVPGSGPEGGAAVIRGPMAGRVVTQLLKGTDWGELDVLVMDLPPGTGDVQISVCQDLELSGAVAVTTPSKLAATDARKGIEMFTSLGVPTLAAVENMAYFVCEGGGKHYPFGKGAIDIKSPNVLQLPISTITNDANDSGEPLCLSRPDGATEELGVFQELASAVAKELLLIQHGRSRAASGGMEEATIIIFPESDERFDVATTHLSLDGSDQGFFARLFSDAGAIHLFLSAEELRSRDPKTGEKLELASSDERNESDATTSDGMVQLHIATRSTRLMPATIEKKGKYGYSVDWADGATIIYSMLSIAKAAGGKAERQ